MTREEYLAQYWITVPGEYRTREGLPVFITRKGEHPWSRVHGYIVHPDGREEYRDWHPMGCAAPIGESPLDITERHEPRESNQLKNKILITPKEMQDVLANPHGHDIKWPTNSTKEGKKLALSYSKIETFETCPRQFAERFIYQTVPYKSSPILEWGNKVHKALEEYVFNEKEIKDPSIKPFESAANALIEKENSLHDRGILQTPLFGEQSWACDLTMRAHSWFDNDGIFIRGKADAGMATKNTLFVYDWKTGQGKNPKPAQLELMGLLAMAQPNIVPPSVTKIDGTLVFLEARKTVSHRIMTADYQEHWKNWVKKAFTILDAYQRDSFPEVQSGLCGKWCDCYECPFNGRNADGTPR